MKRPNAYVRMCTTHYKVTVTRSELEALDTLCAGIVTRDGEQDACCKPATTVIYDAESGHVWPGCTWHAHRYGGAVTLAVIRDAVTNGAAEFEREESSW